MTNASNLVLTAVTASTMGGYHWQADGTTNNQTVFTTVANGTLTAVPNGSTIVVGLSISNSDASVAGTYQIIGGTSSTVYKTGALGTSAATNIMTTLTTTQATENILLQVKFNSAPSSTLKVNGNNSSGYSFWYFYSGTPVMALNLISGKIPSSITEIKIPINANTTSISVIYISGTGNGTTPPTSNSDTMFVNGYLQANTSTTITSTSTLTGSGMALSLLDLISANFNTAFGIVIDITGSNVSFS